MSTQQLSEQEKRVKIAEECGWTEVHEAKRHHDSPHTVGLHPMKFGSGSAYEEIPDFFADLNAIHEAEKVLTGEQKWKYLEILGSENEFSWSLRHATAAQCAEAFGISCGLWT